MALYTEPRPVEVAVAVSARAMIGAIVIGKRDSGDRRETCLRSCRALRDGGHEVNEALMPEAVPSTEAT